jgi:hypothetical protein
MQSDASLAQSSQFSAGSSGPFKTFIWKSRVHSVPQSFVFPQYVKLFLSSHTIFQPLYHLNSTDVKTLWMLWQHGNTLEHIGPYRGLRGYDLDNNDGTDLSKARIVMTALGEFSLLGINMYSIYSVICL